jgi:uncharacterized protein (TIGR04255 family)
MANCPWGKIRRVARKKQAKLARLPNAPLVEVVFELRWKLYDDAIPPPFRIDPGVLPLLKTFSAKMTELGFGSAQDIGRVEQTVGLSVLRRFRRAPDQAFPLMQVGSGIFATNEGPMYEWERYRDQVLQGVEVLLDSYPNLNGYPLQPDHLELRYRDIFDETLLQTGVLTEFLSRGTTMTVEPPPFLRDPERFEASMPTRVVFHATPQGRKETQFVVDFGTVVHEGRAAFSLENKVVTRDAGVPTLDTKRRFIPGLEKWLEFAHGLTSSFFKSFVRGELMEQFEKSSAP